MTKVCSLLFWDWLAYKIWYVDSSGLGASMQQIRIRDFGATYVWKSLFAFRSIYSWCAQEMTHY